MRIRRGGINYPDGITELPHREKLNAAQQDGIISGVDSSRYLDSLSETEELVEVHGYYSRESRVITLSQLHYPHLSTFRRRWVILHELGHAVDHYTAGAVSGALVEDPRDGHHYRRVERAANRYMTCMHPGIDTDPRQDEALAEILRENGIPDPLIPDCVESK